MAPTPTGAASCMYSPRRRTVRTASAKPIAPAATSAEYSPRLCPATQSGRAPRASRGRRAARLAARIEDDCAVAWRAVLEQSGAEDERKFALTALTQCAVLAARWRQVLGAWPVTRAFPGGSE